MPVCHQIQASDLDDSLQIVVLGAGIIGIATALQLRTEGHRVCLVDRGEPGRETSFGNMGGIAATEFAPISRPATWLKLPRWLLDPTGPVRVRAGYIPRAAPWLWAFLRAGRRRRVLELEAAGAVLCARVYDDLNTLLRHSGLEHLLRKQGCICIYGSISEWRSDSDRRRMLQRFQIPHEVLDGTGIRALEPAISRRFERALYLPDWQHVTDPYALSTGLLARFLEAGGELVRAQVEGLRSQADGRIGLDVQDPHCGLNSRRFHRAVLACGAWTGKFAEALGEHLPLETERGYHTQIKRPGIELHYSVLRPAQAFVTAPVGEGIRVGGTVEFAGLQAAPDYRRARAMVRRAQQIFPQLEIRDTQEWMGHRPAVPDTIPVIGPSTRMPGVFYATGHGHLGLTLAATTARLIADAVAGRRSNTDLQAYSIARFQPR